jgi:hypothetical protein
MVVEKLAKVIVAFKNSNELDNEMNGEGATA